MRKYNMLYTLFFMSILLVLEIQRFKSVKACRPIARQAAVNANSSANSLKSIAIQYLFMIIKLSRFVGLLSVLFS
ncbi:MAG: hypothetical protein LBP59_05975 [Planctomycetaceae bacterium]|nr:hypothetical protein [Planctomycetaceae bacterium]